MDAKKYQRVVNAAFRYMYHVQNLDDIAILQEEMPDFPRGGNWPGGEMTMDQFEAITQEARTRHYQECH